MWIYLHCVVVQLLDRDHSVVVTCGSISDIYMYVYMSDCLYMYKCTFIKYSMCMHFYKIQLDYRTVHVQY